MTIAGVYEAGLRIAAPWHITAFDVEEDTGTLTLQVEFEHGSRFCIPGSDELLEIFDVVPRVYRHQSFFNRPCLLRVRIPVVRARDESLHLIIPEFLNSRSGFNLLPGH